MRWYSSGGTMPPVGLLGELRMSNFVRGVTAFSMAEAFTLTPSSGFVSTKTGVPPAYFTMSGKLTQYGAGIMISSPCWTSTLITLKMECLPPTLTTHSFASYEEPSSRLCHAQIANSALRMTQKTAWSALAANILLRHTKSRVRAYATRTRLFVCRKRMFAANADHAFFCDIRRAEFALMPRADRFAQRHDAARRCVFRLVFLDRLDRGFLDVVRRGKVRLAGAEVRDIHSTRLQLLRFGDHCGGRRNLYAIDTVRKLHLH